MNDLHNFKKLTPKQQLEAVAKFISGFPRDRREELTRELVIDKKDQEKVIKRLKELEKI